MTTLVPVSESLFHVEDDLAALLNSLDLCETDEQKQQIELEILLALAKSVAKRDQINAWLNREMSYVMAGNNEIVRIQQINSRRMKAISRVEEYVASVMLTNETPRLEGTKCVFKLKKNPAAVEITDDLAIPERFETVCLQFSPEEWESFTDDLGIETYAVLADHIRERKPVKTAIKKALDAGEQVPGARIAPVKYRLERD